MAFFNSIFEEIDLDEVEEALMEGNYSEKFGEKLNTDKDLEYATEKSEIKEDNLEESKSLTEDAENYFENLDDCIDLGEFDDTEDLIAPDDSKGDISNKEDLSGTVVMNEQNNAEEYTIEVDDEYEEESSGDDGEGFNLDDLDIEFDDEELEYEDSGSSSNVNVVQEAPVKSLQEQPIEEQEDLTEYFDDDDIEYFDDSDTEYEEEPVQEQPKVETKPEPKVETHVEPKVETAQSESKAEDNSEVLKLKLEIQRLELEKLKLELQNQQKVEVKSTTESPKIEQSVVKTPDIPARKEKPELNISKPQNKPAKTRIELEIEMFSRMNTDTLIGYVNKYMTKKNINKGLIGIQELQDRFGKDNILRLIKAGYIIRYGKQVTVGK